jgi:hypothetical protein
MHLTKKSSGTPCGNGVHSVSAVRGRAHWLRTAYSRSKMFGHASDHKLSVIGGLGDRGQRKVCELAGRKPPTNAKLLEERQAEVERA